MTLLKKLMLMLFLGMVLSGPAAPILKSYFGIGSTTAHAQDNDQGDDEGNDEDQDNNDQ